MSLFLWYLQNVLVVANPQIIGDILHWNQRKISNTFDFDALYLFSLSLSL